LTKTIETVSELTGVFTALFTPLKDDDPKCLKNSIDYSKAESMIDHLIEVGISGLIPIGTTGQSATVTTQQHIDFIKFTVEYTNNRVPIIAGAGSNSTRESIEIMNAVLKSTGNLCFLCVTGYYNNPPQQGLIQHFNTLVNEINSNIVIYNVPGRTNSYLKPETIIELAQNEKIIGLKQAVDFITPGPMRQDTIQILTHVNPQQFSVLTGEDNSLHALLNLGGKGIISATGNIPEAAALYLKLLDVYQKGNVLEAESIQKNLQPYIDACFIRKNPMPLATLFNSPIYQPMVPVIQTEGGQLAHNQLMDFIKSYAPSLAQYHT